MVQICHIGLRKQLNTGKKVNNIDKEKSMDYYCPICGNGLKESFGLGEICNCCFNESYCDDSICWESLDLEIGYDLCKKVFPEYFLKQNHYKSMDGFADKEIVWKLLRAKWCAEKFPCYSRDQKKKKGYLSHEEAEAQLKNIGVSLEELEKILSNE